MGFGYPCRALRDAQTLDAPYRDDACARVTSAWQIEVFVLISGVVQSKAKIFYRNIGILDPSRRISPVLYKKSLSSKKPGLDLFSACRSFVFFSWLAKGDYRVDLL